MAWIKFSGQMGQGLEGVWVRKTLELGLIGGNPQGVSISSLTTVITAFATV